jgi:hypothetical protein
LKEIYVVEATFFAGHIKTGEGQSVVQVAIRMAGQIALVAAKVIVQSDTQLNILNEAYGRNTVRLFIAKQLHIHINYWTLRAIVAQALCTTSRAKVWLRKPTLFDGRLLAEVLPGVDLYFYPTAGVGLIKLVLSWILDVARDMKLTLCFGRRNRPSTPAKSNKPSVLMFQEDDIHANRSLRGQPHWVDVSNPMEKFDTYLIELRGLNFSIPKDISILSKARVTIIPTSAFRFAMHAMRNHKTISRVRRDRRATLRAIFHASGFANKYFLLRVAFLLRQAALMAALSLCLNVRVFLIRETYYSFADAMQLVAPDLNVTTLAYQYSNMGSVSPVMMSTADKFLIFADMYKAIYQSDGITPKEFLPTGYLYDGVASLVRNKANKHRAILNTAGATFIVCYFDESVQQDRWGLVSKGDHLGELHALAKAVISDATFGVVVKSQFIRNSPSQLYPKDEIIQAAKATGRYLELMEGVLRNDIYPTESALAADLCISQKIGASAALEAAIAGVRTVLLNPYGSKTLWDTIYSKGDIVYESMDLLMGAVVRYRAGNEPEKNLGDWTPILHYFDPYRDGKAVERLRREISVSI